MSVSFSGQRPVLLHQIVAQKDENTEAELFQKATRWEAKDLGAKLLKSGYKKVEPLSWQRPENDPSGPYDYRFDRKTWADIQAILTRTPGGDIKTGRPPLTIAQSEKLQEVGNLMRGYGKAGVKNGLADDQITEIIMSFGETMKALGITIRDMREPLNHVYNPQPAPQTEVTPVQ